MMWMGNITSVPKNNANIMPIFRRHFSGVHIRQATSDCTDIAQRCNLREGQEGAVAQVKAGLRRRRQPDETGEYCNERISRTNHIEGARFLNMA